MAPFAIRHILFLLLGGSALAWINPPEGITRYGLLLGVIFLGALAEHVLFKKNPPKMEKGKVVSMGSQKAKPARKKTWQTRERRVLQPMFSSPSHAEADAVAMFLRGEGMNPVLVTQNKAGAKESVMFELRLPVEEAKTAKPMIERFLLKSSLN